MTNKIIECDEASKWLVLNFTVYKAVLGFVENIVIPRHTLARLS